MPGIPFGINLMGGCHKSRELVLHAKELVDGIVMMAEFFPCGHILQKPLQNIIGLLLLGFKLIPGIVVEDLQIAPDLGLLLAQKSLRVIVQLFIVAVNPRFFQNPNLTHQFRRRQGKAQHRTLKKVIDVKGLVRHGDVPFCRIY